MKTLAVTAGLGPFAGFARRLASRFERLNGIHLRVIGPRDVRRFGARLASPMLVKLLAWEVVPRDVERIVWVDADCVPIEPLGEIPRAPFAAVGTQASDHQRHVQDDHLEPAFRGVRHPEVPVERRLPGAGNQLVVEFMRQSLAGGTAAGHRPPA